MTTQKWIKIISLLIPLAIIFIAAGLPETKPEVLTAVFVIVLTLNIIRLIRAIMLRKEIKNNGTVRCSAVIKLSFSPTGCRNGLSTGHALAEYSLNGKIIKGWMIGLYDGRLNPGDNVYIIVNKRRPTMFAFSEEQVGTAVMNYTVFTVISAVLAAGCLGYLIVSGGF